MSNFVCFFKRMMKFQWIVLAFLLFSTCVTQAPAENRLMDDDNSQSPASTPARTTRRVYNYYIQASSDIVGYNVLVNGCELYVNEGGKATDVRIDINDWMISGNNELAITIFWPDGVRFSADSSSALFKLCYNENLIKEFKILPTTSINNYPHEINETFMAGGFPKVLLEKAERVISSTGELPLSEQEKISDIAQQLRKALTEKNIAAIHTLLNTKYTDLAAARFTTFGAIKEESDKYYKELMERPGYALRPFSGRYRYFSTADDRVVHVVQGRIGFPEPALVITWQEGRSTRRLELELYFARIGGQWVIIR